MVDPGLTGECLRTHTVRLLSLFVLKRHNQTNTQCRIIVNVAQDVAVACHRLKFHCCHYFTAFTHVSYNFTSFYINSFNNYSTEFFGMYSYCMYIHYLQNGTFLFMQYTCKGKHSLNAYKGIHSQSFYA